MTDYCILAWFRSHGIDEADYSDEVVAAAIRESSLFIDDFTGMWFDERSKTFKRDGSGTNFLHFTIPIINISEVNYTNPATGATSALTVATDLAVYNRDAPDDRLNPKIRLNSASGVFPRGRMNIEIIGDFGFTLEDPDNPGTRITPLDIIRTCRLLVLRDLNHPIEDLYAQAELDMQATVKKEKTDKHSIEYRDTPLGSAQLTGVHSIDGVLIKYRKLRPPAIEVIR